MAYSILIVIKATMTLIITTNIYWVLTLDQALDSMFMNELHLVLTTNHNGGMIFFPILKIRKLRLRNTVLPKVTQLVRGLT